MKKIELIDPPVSPFSSKKDIRKWLVELQAAEKPYSAERKAAIREAKSWLKRK